MTVLFFANGNTAVCDDSNQQVPELQAPWLLEYVKHLEAHGIDPSTVEFNMPDLRKAKLFRIGEGHWNWSFL